MVKQLGFVILTWNSQRTIQECLESVFQMPCCAQVVVVDNGSSDDTLRLMESFSDQRLQVIRNHTNLGTTVSRNQGIRALSKDLDYVCILDSDTVVTQEAFDQLTGVLESNENCMLVGPAMVNASGERMTCARNYPSPFVKMLRMLPMKKVQRFCDEQDTPPCASNDRPYPVDYLLSACWLLKPEAFEQVGLLDENIFYAPEDVEYCTRIRRNGFEVFHCPSACIVHHWQRISKKKLFSYHNYQHICGLIYLWRKYGVSGR